MQHNTTIHYEAALNWWVALHNTDGTANETVRAELQDVIQELTTFTPQLPIDDNTVTFTCNLDNHSDTIRIRATLSCATEDATDETYCGYIDNIIIARIKDICFVLNLAYPGLFHINHGCVYRNGTLIDNKFRYCSDLLSLACDHCTWPVIEQLGIAQCWDWIVSKTHFLRDISITPIDRALHVLSYYSDSDENKYIFYVLLGIEALYNNGSNSEDSIATQIRRKATAILGNYEPRQAKTIKKHLREMYSMRSSLVHGRINIEKSWQAIDCTDPQYEELINRLTPIILATAILLATIQQMIKSNTNAITETISVTLE